jgi:hypothetical protein
MSSSKEEEEERKKKRLKLVEEEEEKPYNAPVIKQYITWYEWYLLDLAYFRKQITDGLKKVAGEVMGHPESMLDGILRIRHKPDWETTDEYRLEITKFPLKDIIRQFFIMPIVLFRVVYIKWIMNPDEEDQIQDQEEEAEDGDELLRINNRPNNRRYHNQTLNDHVRTSRDFYFNMKIFVTSQYRRLRANAPGLDKLSFADLGKFCKELIKLAERELKDFTKYNIPDGVEIHPDLLPKLRDAFIEGVKLAYEIMILTVPKNYKPKLQGVDSDDDDSGGEEHWAGLVGREAYQAYIERVTTAIAERTDLPEPPPLPFILPSEEEENTTTVTTNTCLRCLKKTT